MFLCLWLAGLFAASATNAQEPELPHRLLVSAIYKLYTVNESRNVEWVYEHVVEKNPVILDAWALPNGNTLICNGDFHIKELPRGEVMIFEVTPEKEVVWKLTRTDVGKTLPPMMQGENPIYRTTQVSLIREEIAP